MVVLPSRVRNASRHAGTASGKLPEAVEFYSQAFCVLPKRWWQIATSVTSPVVFANNLQDQYALQ
jgi:hypothetical protein